MEDLNKKRSEFGQNEMNHAKLVNKHFEKQRQRFEYADTAQWLLQNKNETDLIFISEKLAEWSEKAKPENRKQFDDLILTLFRIQSYCVNLETTCKASVAEFVSESKKVIHLESEIRKLKIENLNEVSKLKLELENVKKELEFVNSSR